jgi:hypothetical protein
MVWPCGEAEALYGVAGTSVAGGFVSVSGVGCCWAADGAAVVSEGAVVVWEAIESPGALCPSCGLGCAEDGEEESGGEGNRDAPPLADTAADSTVAAVSADSQDRFEGVALDAVVLYLGGVVGERVWEGADGSRGRFFELDRYENSRECECSCCRPEGIMLWWNLE